MALELTSQLLKSLNACVLRTGGAALGTVTVLVDDVLRPALARAGVDPAAVGVVRSTDHSAAQALVSVPELIPLVILRGSGARRASLPASRPTRASAFRARGRRRGALHRRAADPESHRG